MNWLVQLVARALEPGEREVVLGDLAESGASGTSNFFGVLGIVARRQLEVWKDWRPWFALIGVVGISGAYMSRLHYGLGISIFEQQNTWRRYDVHYGEGSGFHEDLLYMVCLSMAISCWSAVGGLLLGRFSGRAAWLTGILFYFVVFDSWPARLALAGTYGHGGGGSWLAWLVPLNMQSLAMCAGLFLIPATLGATGRLPRMALATVAFSLIAAMLAVRQAHAVEVLTEGAITRPWPLTLLPFVLASWPVVILWRDARHSKIEA